MGDFVSRAQVSAETMVVFGVGLILLLVLIVIVYNQANSGAAQEQVQVGSVALNSLVKEINNAAFLGPGTVKTVVIRMPDSVDYSKSSILGKSLVLNVSGTDLINSASVDVRGDWPNASGTNAFVITVYDGYVTISPQKLSFDPVQISETLVQSTSKDVNLVVTNLASSSLDYNLVIGFPSGGSSDAGASSSLSNPVSFPASSATSVPLHLYCSSSSAGSYSGNLTFVSVSGDTNFTVPVNVVCSSGQTKLSVFPGVNNAAVRENGCTPVPFRVCNSSNSWMNSVTFSSSDANSGWLAFPSDVSIAPYSCTDINIGVRAPLGTANTNIPISFSANSLSFSGLGIVCTDVVSQNSGSGVDTNRQTAGFANSSDAQLQNFNVNNYDIQNANNVYVNVIWADQNHSFGTMYCPDGNIMTGYLVGYTC